MSMTVAYIIFGIVMLHLLLGFVWVFYKFYKKRKPAEEEAEKRQDTAE